VINITNKTFTNLNDLYKYLESQVEVNLQKIGIEIAGILKHYVQENWYNRMDSVKLGFDQYERTMEVLNSISVEKVKKVGNTFEVKIFFDETKIHSIHRDGTWNAHMSLDGSTEYGGMSIPEWVVWWMNYGQNSSVYPYPGGGFLEATIEWNESDKYHINRMRELLQDKGFIVI
jgi:hypothetical protein